MAPAKIQYIIRKAQENHAADGKERTYQGHKLGEARAGPSSSLRPLHLSKIPVFSLLSPFTQTQTTPTLSGSSQPPGPCNRSHSPTYFMVREGFTPLLHKAVQERERDEAEEDDKENSTADHSLGLWAVAQQQRAGAEGEERGRGHSLVQALQQSNGERGLGKGTSAGVPDNTRGSPQPQHPFPMLASAALHLPEPGAVCGLSAPSPWGQTPVPALALPAPSSALATRTGPGCHRSHLLTAGFVEVLATKVRGDEVATKGGDEGDRGHKSQQRADQIH